MWDSILNGCAWLLSQLATLVGDWGLAIIIVTLIVRFVLFPLQRKQFKSSHDMQRLQPRIQEIQTLYADDKQRMQEEMSKVYSETGFNPLAGCLPLIIQMPIFIILFQVLRWKIYDYAAAGNVVSFYNIIPDLTLTVGDAWATSIAASIPYIVLAVLFMGFSVAPMVLQYKQADSQQRSQMMIMLVMMGAMFVWMAFVSPAGVMIFWALSSAFGFFQQIFQNKTMEKEDEEEEAKKKAVAREIKTNVQRREKKKRPRKKH